MAPLNYAFVQDGPFSGWNSRLLRALDEELAPLSGVKIDLRDERRIGRGVLLNVPPASYGALVKEYWQLWPNPRLFINKRRFTTYMFDFKSHAGQLAASRLEPAFVFQTMGVFNARVQHLPFFIYTDHTVLANRRYPVVPRDQNFSAQWIARERQLYLGAQHIFVSTEFTRHSLLTDYGCHDDRVTVVGSGVNLNPPPVCPVRNRVPRNILFVGYDWERKGGPELLAAYEQLHSEGYDLRLSIVGASPRISVEGVAVHGKVGGDNVATFFSEADIFCMPSHQEPSAGVYLEAAAFGLPIVATRVGGTPERVFHGVTGYLCEPGDVSEMVAWLRKLIDEPATAMTLGQAGYEYVLRTGTWRAVADKIASVVTDVLAGCPRT